MWSLPHVFHAEMGSVTAIVIVIAMVFGPRPHLALLHAVDMVWAATLAGFHHALFVSVAALWVEPV